MMFTRDRAIALTVTLVGLLTLAPTTSSAQPDQGAVAAAPGPGTNYATDDPFTAERTAWFRDNRFGMFIHFGAYSNLEGEYTRPDGSTCQYSGGAEWLQYLCSIPKDEYEKQAATFNPKEFDAKAIVAAAKSAGQKYIVITTKHHDGYAMWPTKQNTWNLRDHSSFDKNRDILAELKQAADAEGIKLGFYYSIWDWHDPNFTGDFPQYKERMRAQLKELIDGYDPDLMWFDGEWTVASDRPVNPWSARDGEELESYLRDLDPSMVINNRVGKRRVSDGDYGTPEQEIPEAPVDGQLWESCMTMNNTWGYSRRDNNWKSGAELTRNLLNTTSRSGNYLLNIGPDKLGRVPAPSIAALKEIGDWLDRSGQGAAIYKAGFPGVVAEPDWGVVSRSGNDLYASVYHWPGAGKPLHLTTTTTGFTVGSASVLGSGQKVTVTKAGDGYDIIPSGDDTNPAATVIKLSITPPAPTAEGTGTGLKAEIFDNDQLSGSPRATRTDPTINYAWRFGGSPAESIPSDHFGTRWTGTIEPRYSEKYVFTTVSDDTVRVWVDGRLIIDNTRPHAPTVDKGAVDLQAGKKYAIRVEHTEQTGEAHMKLLWSSPNTPQQIVPSSQLSPN
ncbi:alpha-L-fucosidase [Streptomyces sp. NBC_00887]|uniref:alpha-L-fucosidase n=1 Tax=Streptomyces sp. NBC_00887 TaxID=2975859 RepID=UPI0038665B44|nr:alpha-L-fucosidase [Streptomyces sp. NBC_00887]WSY36854.1 alpha-L-fucosidase [Streptomyces sp. NBC_00887]